jgi:glycosyltransferase involved in cell wall biosynthesis
MVKRLIFTAHDINYRNLIGRDTLINRLSLKFMYNIVDHLIVHTERMKKELIDNYHIEESKISTIPFGINVVMPKTDLTGAQAKARLNLEHVEKNILFFGNIAPYKGLEYLIRALAHLKREYKDIKLIIAGRIKVGCNAYWENILKLIDEHKLENNVIKRIEYIPEEEAEVYFKAADVLILPYKKIFQSGVIYTSYYFGLPVIATDVGSLGEDIVEGKTGFVCRPEDPQDLTDKISLYFQSDLFRNLEESRRTIFKYAVENHSWERTGDRTYTVYENVI